MKITFEDIKASKEVNIYIEQADASLLAMGYTEHSFIHVNRCAGVAANILSVMGYSEREVELAKIAAYMHDIGNVINRDDHAQSGAIMAFRILDRMNMDPAEIATVITAIGNHDESTAHPVNAVAAALILADKTDVRRTRVRQGSQAAFDIHDRVNFAVEQSSVEIDKDAGSITLQLTINTELCPVMSYFEIFMERMLLCKKAAKFFQLEFKLKVNGQRLL